LVISRKSHGLWDLDVVDESNYEPFPKVRRSQTCPRTLLPSHYSQKIVTGPKESAQHGRLKRTSSAGYRIPISSDHLRVYSRSPNSKENTHAFPRKTSRPLVPFAMIHSNYTKLRVEHRHPIIVLPTRMARVRCKRSSTKDTIQCIG